MGYLSSCCRTMEMILRILYLGILLVGLRTYSEAQPKAIPENYLKIVPGVSTRDDVKKVFPTIEGKGQFVKLETSELIVHIEYSAGECTLPLGWGRLPAWTVERISYEWPEGKKVRLADVVLDLAQFRKQQPGHVPVHDYYVNENLGIKVIYDRKWKEVQGIDIEPSAELKAKYVCQDLDS